MISDMTSRQILDAIDRALEEVAQQFAKDAAKSTAVSPTRQGVWLDSSRRTA
jgi:hypothetical protein